MFRLHLLIAIACSWALVLATPSVASAQGGSQMATLEVIPPNPTDNDVITLKLSGDWRNSCAPQNPQVSIFGDMIQIATTGLSSQCPPVCLPVVTPWSLTVPIGLLSAGSHQVAMSYALCSFQEPVLVDPSTFTVQAGNQVLDHFKCYRVDLEDPRPGQFRSQQPPVALDDQFEQEPGATVRRPELLCNPVSKNGEEIKNPDEHLVCYKTTPPAKQPSFGKREVIVNNQFGQQTLRVWNRDNLVCVPSQKAEVPQCGGIAGLQCVSKETCDLRDATCSSVDLAGVCVPRPDVCPQVFDPVCGCDRVTYPNDCERIKAGATLAHAGAC